jgi:long-chain acyl-CoA synthetase
MDYKNIADMFFGTTQKCSSKKLLVYKKNNNWIALNGKDIQITVEDISFGLRSLGITEKSNIAILSNNSPKWAMCDYGIICSAMTTVTIYPTLISSQIEFILKNSNSKLVFVENQEQLNKIKDSFDLCDDLKYIVVMDGSCENETDYIINFVTLLDKGKAFSQNYELSFHDMINSIDEKDVLTIIYTSGTTGVPKGVVLTHKNLLSNVEATLKAADFNLNERFLSFLPLSHVLERMGGHYTAFSIGATIYYAESMETIAENMVELKPTIVVCVPRVFEKIHTKFIEGLKSAPKIRQKLFYWALSVGKKYSSLKLDKQNPNLLLKIKHGIADKLIYSKVKARFGGSIKFFVSGGAPLSKELAEFFAAVDMTILEGYGLTETSPVLTVNSPTDLKFGYVGKPLFNVQIKIADDGEILAKGPNIMVGYYKNEKATNEAFDEEGWFKTGDIGHIDEDGFLKITDRKKNLIVTSSGKNIAPAPIEVKLTSSSYIEQAHIIGDKRNFLTALIVPNFDSVINYLKNIENNMSDLNAIIDHPDVIELFNREIEGSMTDFARFEKVKKFTLISEPFSIEKGEMTPKMSIVRKVVEKNYSELINGLYN